MSDILAVRRSVSELMLLYELEPSTRHVLVEGKMDKAVISHFLDALRIDGDVYRLDDYVDMSELLAEEVARTGVRARLEMLAWEFDAKLGDSSSNRCLTCVVDLDDGVQAGAESLLVTDYADMELYVWDARRFPKLLRLSIGLDDAELIASLMVSATTRAMLCCRCRRVIHEMQSGATPPARLTRYACPRSGEFDLEGYLRAFGGEVARGAATLAERVRSDVAAIPPEHTRLNMNGHDLIQIVSALLTRAGHRVDGAQLELMWFTVLEPRDLAEAEPLFASLAARVAG